MTRNYSANAVTSALSAGVNDTVTTIPVTVTTGFPAAPFIIALDYGAAEQELALVTAVAGLNLTATRGYDSTTAQAHSLGAVVRHVHSAIDFRDSRTHEAATSGVHGVTGSFVGTTDTQALSNKDLSSGTNTFPATHVTTAGTQTLTNKTLALGSNTVSGTKAQFNTALTDGDFATLAGTETLTGKTVDLTDNTVTGTIAEFNTAVSDADLATLAGTETLTNKTLTTPTITSPVISDPAISGIGQIVFVSKISDETVTTSTTLQDDDTLAFTAAANATYVLVGGSIGYDLGVPDANGGIKWSWSGPSGVAFKLATAAFTTTGDTGANIHATTGSVSTPARVITTTGGIVKLQWAQSSSSATATKVVAGSYLAFLRVA